MIFNEDLTVLLGTGFCTSACNNGCDLQVSSLRLLESCSIANTRACLTHCEKTAHKLLTSTRVAFDVMVTIAMSKALVFFGREIGCLQVVVYSYISPSCLDVKRCTVKNFVSNCNPGTQPSIF